MFVVAVLACLQSILGAPGRQPETENFLRCLRVYVCMSVRVCTCMCVNKNAQKKAAILSLLVGS